MKNIHIVPTDEPSRLSDCHDDVRYLRSYKNIYITNDEGIKRYLDYYLDINTNEVKTSFENIGKYSPNEKKIILTTDQDLIKDGVQAIDDEFLEWFIKNPNCEEVKTTNRYGDHQPIKYDYCIIIPNKNTLDSKPGDNKQARLLKELSNDLLNIQKTIEEITESQQVKSYSEEDMKQFAFNCVSNFLSNKDNKVEMDLVNIIINRNDAQFEQFKKK